MSQEGDFVIVTYPSGWRDPYRVLRVLPHQAKLAEVGDPGHVLIVKIENGVWTLPDHEIQHIGANSSFLTGDHETDALTLSRFTDETINHLCEADEYVNELCSEEEFWKLRVETCYPDLTGGLEEGEGWHEYCTLIPNLLDHEGKLDRKKLIYHWRMKLLEKLKDDLSLEDANYAASIGHQGILDWMAQNNLYLPSEEGINEAAINGYDDVLRWAHKVKLSPPSLSALIEAALNEHYHVLVWAAKSVLCSGRLVEIANKLAAAGRLDGLEWLEENNLPLPDERGARAAVKADHNGVVEWLAEREIFPRYTPMIDEIELGAIIENEPAGVLSNLQAPIPSYAITLAAELDRPDILEVLKEHHGLFPDSADADLALREDAEGALDWMYTRLGILPSRHGADLMARKGQLGALLWLGSKDILPTKQGADEAARHYPDVIEWLIPRGIIPGKHGIKEAIINGRLDVLKILERNGYYKPSQEDVDFALLHYRVRIITWMIEKGVRPSQKATDELRKHIPNGDSFIKLVNLA